MKVIILLGGYGTRMRPHTWSRPKPLLNVAGKTALGHILDEMQAITTEEVIFVVGYKGEQIRAWVEQEYSHLNSHFVVQEQALGQAHAVWLCRDFMESGEIVVAFGDGIVKADFAKMPANADATFLTHEVEDPRKYGVVRLNENGHVYEFVEKPETVEHKKAVVGINWFQEARRLRDAVDTVMEEQRKTKGEYYMADAYGVMLERGAKIVTQPVIFWLDSGNPENMLFTNQRLLSLGYSTNDAIERSYAEGFTVIPPVFLHPDCDIEAAVIGPHASIGANVMIRDSVVKNSIIDAGASVTSCILDGALIGEKAIVEGRGMTLFVGDNSQITLG